MMDSAFFSGETMGFFTEVTGVEAPVSAGAGQTISIQVTLRNKADYSQYLLLMGTYDGHEVYAEPQFELVQGEGSRVFTLNFIMPGQGITLGLWSFLWVEYPDQSGSWQSDDYHEVLIALAATPAAGIAAKLIEYSGLSLPLPAGSVPQGASAKLRVRVRNEMSASQKLGIAWVIVDPDGIVVQSYSDWETFSTGAGDTHDFVGSSAFLLFKVGDYRVRIDAYVYPDGSRSVDCYDGALGAVIPQEVATGLKNTALNIVYGTYDYLQPAPYVLSYDYRGKTQSGTLQIELGTGLYPLFTPEAVIGWQVYSFASQAEYARVTENRSFVLPDTLRRGQAYSVRVTLRTADGVEDGDISYNALRVADPAVPSTELRDLAIVTAYHDYDLGENLPITLSYRYRGVAQSGQIQVIVGKGVIFNTVYTGAPQAITFAQNDVLTTITRDIAVTLPMTLEPGQVYSVKVVLETSDGKVIDQTKGSAFKIAENAIPEDPGVGEYRVVKDYVYPFGETYSGQATQCTYEFTVPLAQMPGGDWISRQILDVHESEVAKQGSRMLHLKVNERDHGLTSKDYLIVATASAPEETAGQEYTPQGIAILRRTTAFALPLLAWAVIIPIALAILGFAITAVIKEIRTFLWGEEGTPPASWGDSVGMLIVMGLMAMVMSAMPKAMDWAKQEAPRLVEKGKERLTAGIERASKWLGERAEAHD